MDRLIEKLKDVPAQYRSAPFWSWNGELEPNELCRQIAKMQENGMGGFVIHARAGLTDEYMGEKWFECIEVCIQEAKRRGMYVWLYDENGWPSGFAGGKLLENKSFLISAVKHEITEAWREGATASFFYKNGKIERVYQPMKRGKYIHIYTYKNHSYVDLCNPDVTESFIRETHDKYYKRFGEEFGKTVRGFFTDEPQWFRSDTPYSDQLVSYFRDKYNEDVIDKLPLLFIDGEGYKEFRFRYYSALNEMINENFFHKLFDWCEAHNCLLTGHGIDERSFMGQMICSGNVMPFYEYMQLPGIDHLQRFYNGTRIAKQVSSVAKQTGRKQILTETFAMTGWDVTFDELRCIAEAQYVGGANYMCQHLYPYSFKGLGRYDHPCAFSDCVSWWEKYAKFNEYFDRIGYMLAESKEETDIAVIHTIKSAYLNWKRADGYNSIMDEEDAFSSIVKQFLGFGIQFDVADESLLLSRGRVENGKLIIGECVYSTIVLPYCSALNAYTVNLLEMFISEGGKILVQHGSPVRLDGGDELREFNSTTSFADIIGNSTFLHRRYSNSIVSTYRKTDFGEFAYVVNRDNLQGHKTEIYIKGMQYASALDLLTLKRSPVLVKGETAFLDVKAASSVILLINDTLDEYKERKTTLVEKIQPSFSFPKENYIILDKAEWSVDGWNYFEHTLVHKIQKNLIKERYDGDLYLRYNLNVNNLPSSLTLSFEYDAMKLFVNEQEVVIEKKDGMCFANIKKHIHFGDNQIVILTHFYQRPYVYDVLFGEDTTESLLNCLYYDTILSEVFVSGAFEIQPIKCVPYGKLYRVSKFVLNGKYSKKNRFGNPIDEGLPFYRGELEYSFDIESEEGEYQIDIQGRFAVAKYSINGEAWQDLTFGNSFDCVLNEGKNTIKITVYSGNRNYYGPFHFNKEDISVAPSTYTYEGVELEVENYDLKNYYFAKFGIDLVEVKRIW